MVYHELTPMETYIEIGKRIREARMRRDITQRQLAEKMEFTSSLLNQFEKGKKKPSLVDAFRMEVILEVRDESISQLVIGADYRAATGFDKHFPTHGGGIEEVAPRSVQSDELNPKIAKLNKITHSGERILGEVISVPVKLPKEIYLKLEFH